MDRRVDACHTCRLGGRQLHSPAFPSLGLDQDHGDLSVPLQTRAWSSKIRCGQQSVYFWNAYDFYLPRLLPDLLDRSTRAARVATLAARRSILASKSDGFDSDNDVTAHCAESLAVSVILFAILASPSKSVLLEVARMPLTYGDRYSKNTV